MRHFVEKVGICTPLRVLLFGLLLFGSAVTASAQLYTVSNLSADVPGAAANTDSNLVGAVGISRGIVGKWWVANSGSATAALYDGNGVASALVVNLPPVPGSSNPTRATATVFSGAISGFYVSPGNPALFMFVTLDGTVLGWNPNVDLSNAIVLVDDHRNASYTGMTIAEVGTAHYLYVVNALTKSIEVFDTSFKQVRFDDDAFQDPNLPEGLVPFNVQNIGKDVVVTYHHQSASDSDDPKGWVAVFTAGGRFVSRLQPGSWLNAPWGVTMTPQDFGEFSHMILVANHGNGNIAAFDPFSGKFVGLMLDPNSNVISINGLWALAFADGGIANFTTVMGSYNACYFTAGTQMGQHGLFGNVIPVASDQTHDEE